jgi:hypothetical protein
VIVDSATTLVDPVAALVDCVGAVVDSLVSPSPPQPATGRRKETIPITGMHPRTQNI